MQKSWVSFTLGQRVRPTNDRQLFQIKQLTVIGQFHTRCPNALTWYVKQHPGFPAHDRTLFFSSLRYGGKGGFDIYYSRMLVPNVSSDPIPIDTLNSPIDGIYPSVTFDGRNIVFQRQFPKNDGDLGNIFFARTEDKFLPQPMAILDGQVTDLETSSPIEANVSISDANSSKSYLNIYSNIFRWKI